MTEKTNIGSFHAFRAEETDSNLTMSEPIEEGRIGDDFKGSDERKVRKYQRARLPLPNPLPEKIVPRYPEPSKDELSSQIRAENTRLQQCYAQLNSVRTFYESRQRIRDSNKPQFDEARTRYGELAERCRELFEERKLLSSKLKALREKDVAARTSQAAVAIEIPGVGKDGNEALRGIRSIEDLSLKIAELQFRQETESLSIGDEKRLVQQISFLHHKGRAFVLNRQAQIVKEQDAKQKRASVRVELENERKSLDATIDTTKLQLEEQKVVMDRMRSEQLSKFRELEKQYPKIDRDIERKNISDIKARIRQIRDEFQSDLDKWYLNERIYFEQQKRLKKKRYEARLAERSARLKAWEEEQAQYPEPHPCQEELDMCSALQVYLKHLLGESTNSDTEISNSVSSGPNLRTTGKAREIPAIGRVIGKLSDKNTELYDNLKFGTYLKKSTGGRSKKSRSRPQVSREEGLIENDQPLRPHSIDYIAAFSRLGIDPPLKYSDIRDVVLSIKAKETALEDRSFPRKNELPACEDISSALKQNTRDSESWSVSRVNEGLEAFPGLVADAPLPASVTSENTPSFIAVTLGTVPPCSGPESVIVSGTSENPKVISSCDDVEPESVVDGTMSSVTSHVD